MSTYVMSDLHGCFDEFMRMLEEIGFSDRDDLILAGDYIDRGKQNYDMLKWMESDPDNVLFIKGNHDVEFVANVELMSTVGMATGVDLDSNEDALTMYTALLSRKDIKKNYFFDYYGTMKQLLLEEGVCLSELIAWADIVKGMPLYYKCRAGDRIYYIVHAGMPPEIGYTDEQKEEFCIYAREEAFIVGGVPDATVISGHTPTIFKGEFCYNHGKVFRHYNKDKNRTFYDIDCGCVYREYYPEGRLACMRLGDEEVFYV